MTTQDHTHLHALQVRLTHERARLHNSKTTTERAIRSAWIDQIEKEIADEERRLGMDEIPDMTDDEILTALMEGNQ